MGIPQSTRLCCLEKTTLPASFHFLLLISHTIPIAVPPSTNQHNFSCACPLPCCAQGGMKWRERLSRVKCSLKHKFSPKILGIFTLGSWFRAQQYWEYPERFKAQTGDLNKPDTLPCWLAAVSLLISELQPSYELWFKHSGLFWASLCVQLSHTTDTLPICPRDPLFSQPTPEKQGPLQIADHPFNYISIVMLAH